MRARVALAVAATFAALLVGACGEEEILLARLPRDGGLPGEPKRCVDTTDCTGSAYCERAHCGDEGGLCTAKPTECDDEGPPVCGCDGITYWNDCLRGAAGVSSLGPGGAHRMSRRRAAAPTVLGPRRV